MSGSDCSSIAQMGSLKKFCFVTMSLQLLTYIITVICKILYYYQVITLVNNRESDNIIGEVIHDL